MKTEKENKIATEIKSTQSTNKRALSLKSFEIILDRLRHNFGYNYVEAQRYFKRVHEIEKDQFEELCAELK